MSIRTRLGRGRLRHFHWRTVCLCVALLTPNLGLGQSGATDTQAALAEAERAYQEIDYATVYSAALRGLAAGQASVVETARLNVLVGMAAALLGHDEESRAHFLVALAVQPSLDLEQDLSPRVRGPYMEALGFWRALRERLGLRIKLEPGSTRLKYQVTDPTHLVAKIVVYVRQRGATEFVAQSMVAKPRGTLELGEDATRSGCEYFAELVDERGNRLFTRGSEDEPLVVTGPSATNSGVKTRTEHPGQPSAKSSRSLLIPIGTFTASAALAAAGVYFNVRREQAAARWNGSECEQPGRTRIQQCGDVDSERTRMQWLAVGAYSAAGALAVVGTTLLLIPPQAERASGGTSAQCALGAFSVFCQGAF